MPAKIILQAALCAAFSGLPRAQRAQPAPQPGQITGSSSAYTLRVNSQLIVEDVSVTDRQGRPVTGLPGSAFHVTDDQKPQSLVDFREQTTPTASAASPAQPTSHTEAGTVTNVSLMRNQGNLVAILIDPVTMELQDQMYLRLQALKFINAAPVDTSIALFRNNHEGIPVLLQPFTRDKALLRTALSSAVPAMLRPTYNAFHNAVAELHNISSYLRPVPGHKAVLWLAGYFPLYVPPEISLFGGSKPDPDLAGELAQTKDAYRALAEARIAVYPIDVRGVQMGGLSSTPVLNRSTSGSGAVPGALGATPLSLSAKTNGQYEEMDRLAEATGGQAFYSNNDVALLMSTAVQWSSSGYALTYRPADDQPNGKWHVVRITVDGPYTLHYRTGYYAATQPAAPPSTERRGLTAEGGKRPASDKSSPPSGASTAETPLLFSARVLSAGKQGRSTVVKVRYVIPENQLLFDTGMTEGNARFRVAALAYNADGDVLSHGMEIIETHYNLDQMKLASRIGTPADQTLEVASGARYLLLAVEDLRTEKVGTIQLPLATIPAGLPDAGKP